MSKCPRILIIAGSDSGGGAGIQGDIKTACAHKVFATTAITSLTSQNTQGVDGIFDVPPEFVAKQINAVLSDIGTDVIKIGMLSSEPIITAIALSLTPYPFPLVLDTVMLAKGGAALLKPDAVEALKTKLIPLATIVTPNIPEAEVLAGMKINSVDDMVEAGLRILDFGAKAVLVKGGHMEGDEITDVLLTTNNQQLMTSARIQSKNTHGTGCALATAIGCNLALGFDLKQAVEKARAYVFEAIKTAPQIGRGHGPLNHLHSLK